MPLSTHPIAQPAAHPAVQRGTLPRHRAARTALLSLLLMTSGTGQALAAGPTSANMAPGKAGAAAGKPAIQTASKTAAAPRAKPATPRQQLKNEAEGLALATATVETITEAQLNVAMRVLTGPAECEFNERVTVVPVDGQPGHFHVGHKGLRYTMVPEETTTGAVRLVDRRAGMVWLQIPVKSMLMNSKQGRRMVDACTHAEQRAAVKAVAEAGVGLGILPTAPGAPAATIASTTPAAPAAPAAQVAPAATVAEVAAAPASAPR